MAISHDLRLLIALIAAIAGVVGALALRGVVRLLALAAGLLIAAYMVGWLPEIGM